MRISAKIDYACKAILELAMHWPGNKPVQINTIAENQNIPIKFLTQILNGLRQLGYVQSVRGKNGGYLLAREPQKIQLDQLFKDFGYIGFVDNNGQRNHRKNDVMFSIWIEIDEVISGKMEQITFETILNRKKSAEKIAMFEI